MKNYYLLISAVAISISCVKAQPCSDLFISEYVEGSSFNKMIELYNPTSGAIDLSAYQLQTYFNASDSPQYSFQLSGTLAAGDVWVGTNSSADTSIVNNIADATNSFVINWNGNDAVVLLNTASGDTLDIVGVIGDSVSNWVVGSGSTQDHSLVRMASVQEGTTDWSVSMNQWDVYPQNDFSHIGSHNMTPCIVLPDPEVYFLTSNDSVVENASGLSVDIGITNPNSNPTSVDVTATGGSATVNIDYNDVVQTVTFPGNSSTTISLPVTIFDDLIPETDETIILSLSNATNNANISQTNEQIVILDNDGLSVHVISQNNPIMVYPNPAHEYLIWKCALQPVYISIENFLGEELQNLSGATTNQINISLLSSGIYFLKVGDAERTFTVPFVKQ